MPLAPTSNKSSTLTAPKPKWRYYKIVKEIKNKETNTLEVNSNDEEIYEFENIFKFLAVQTSILSLIAKSENAQKKCAEIIDESFKNIYGYLSQGIKNKNEYIFNTATAIQVASFTSFYFSENEEEVKDVYIKSGKKKEYDDFYNQKLSTFGIIDKKKSEKFGKFIYKLRIALAHHNVKFYKNNDIEFTNYDIKNKNNLSYKIRMKGESFLGIVTTLMTFTHNYIALKKV